MILDDSHRTGSTHARARAKHHVVDVYNRWQVRFYYIIIFFYFVYYYIDVRRYAHISLEGFIIIIVILYIIHII